MPSPSVRVGPFFFPFPVGAVVRLCAASPTDTGELIVTGYVIRFDSTCSGLPSIYMNIVELENGVPGRFLSEVEPELFQLVRIPEPIPGDTQ